MKGEKKEKFMICNMKLTLICIKHDVVFVKTILIHDMQHDMLCNMQLK